MVSAPAAAPAQEWADTFAAMQARLSEVGTWEFSATRRGPDGAPECVELWTFHPDGTGLIVSGEQRVTTRWFPRRDAGFGQWVFIANVASTAGPDCMGRMVDPDAYPESDPGYQLLFYADGGGALVCREGRDMARDDGSIVNVLEPEDCWGRIVPAMTGQTE